MERRRREYLGGYHPRRRKEEPPEFGRSCRELTSFKAVGAPKGFLMKMVAFAHAVILPFLLVTANGLGCHLHAFNVTLKSDRHGTCRGSQTLQACVGYCESSAFPSKYAVLLASGFRRNLTSVSQCCTIAKMQKVKVRLRCGESWSETMELFTAKACQCDMCRLSRY